jgi:mannose-1-phosphate guanylyltransferase
VIAFHKKNNAVTTISLWPVEHVSEFGVVDIQNDGNVTGFVEKPKPEDAPSDLINAGAYFLEPQILDYIEKNRLVSMEREIFPQIIKDTGRFFGFEFKGYWIDVGRIKSYIDVHTFLLKKQNIEYFTGDNCRINGRLTDSSIGDTVIIGEDSHITSSIVFDNVKIEKGVVLNHCVLGENCEIKDCSRLTNTVVGDGEVVEENTILENTVVWSQPIPEGYPKKQIGNVIGE